MNMLDISIFFFISYPFNSHSPTSLETLTGSRSWILGLARPIKLADWRQTADTSCKNLVLFCFLAFPKLDGHELPFLQNR